MHTSNDFKALEAVVLDYVARYGLTDKASKYFRVSRQRERVLSRVQTERTQRQPMFVSTRNAEQTAQGADVLVLTEDMISGKAEQD
jgi:hypothetical protein